MQQNYTTFIDRSAKIAAINEELLNARTHRSGYRPPYRAFKRVAGNGVKRFEQRTIRYLK